LAARSRTTFAKRQKEQARKEKQRAKAEKKMQRKLDKTTQPDQDSEFGVQESIDGIQDEGQDDDNDDDREGTNTNP